MWWIRLQRVQMKTDRYLICYKVHHRKCVRNLNVVVLRMFFVLLRLDVIIPNKTAWTTTHASSSMLTSWQVCRKRKWSQILKMIHPVRPSEWAYGSVRFFVNEFGWALVGLDWNLGSFKPCLSEDINKALTKSVGPMLCLVADPLLLSYKSSWIFLAGRCLFPFVW